MTRAQQLESMKEGDKVYRMPYRQYKQHYADCEKVIGSYEPASYYQYGATIEVIIPEGRIKPSGVRGQSFDYFRFVCDDECITLRAIDEEHARKRLPKGKNWQMKEMPPRKYFF